jgi:hypothetical protein
MCVFPLQLLLDYDQLSKQARKMLPFSSPNKLETLIVSRADSASPSVLEQVLKRLSKSSLLRLVLGVRSDRTTVQRLASRWFGEEPAVFVPNVGQVRAWGSKVEVHFIKSGSYVSYNHKTKEASADWSLLSRLSKATQLLERIGNFLVDLDVPTRTALVLLFSQFPQSMKDPKLESLQQSWNENTKPIEWFVETHGIKVQDMASPQLPVVTFSHDKDQVLELNEELTTQVSQETVLDRRLSDGQDRLLCHAVRLSDRLRNNDSATRELWPYLCSLCPAVLRLVVGMPVLLLVNLSKDVEHDQGLVAGSWGTVVSFESGRNPEVCFVSSRGENRVLVLEPVTVRYVLGLVATSDAWYELKQYPIAPAFVLHESLLSVCPIRNSLAVWTRSPRNDEKDFVFKLKGLVHGTIKTVCH